MSAPSFFDSLVEHAARDERAMRTLISHRTHAWQSQFLVRAMIEKLASEQADSDTWTAARDPNIAHDFERHFTRLTEPLLITMGYEALGPLRNALDEAVHRETPPKHRYAALRSQLTALIAYVGELFTKLQALPVLAAHPFDRAAALEELRRQLAIGVTPSKT